MKPAWEFLSVVAPSGNVIRNWFRRNQELQARADAHLRRLQKMDPLWVMPYYRPLGDGVGEIRFDHKNVEHRIYGYFGPGSRQFTMMFGISGKQNQTQIINQAKRMKKQYEANPPRLETYDV
jgi:putative component of toxin-antitoxin plasmid stabilization module